MFNIRDNNLNKLYFNSYKEYLNSKLWLSIKSIIYQRDHAKCRSLSCKKSSLLTFSGAKFGGVKQVHHFDYTIKTLLGLSTKKLITLCETCHEKISLQNGKVVTLQTMQNRTRKVIREKIDSDCEVLVSRRILNNLLSRKTEETDRYAKLMFDFAERLLTASQFEKFKEHTPCLLSKKTPRKK